jgi:hemolysin activation/secretion protein
LNEGLFGALGGRSLGEHALVGGHLSYQFNRIGKGRGDGPQVRERFGNDLPGVQGGTDHLMVGAFFEYDSRNASSQRAFGHRFAPTENRLRSVSLEASRGFYLSTEVTHNVDTQAEQFGFTRYTLDARESIPIDEELLHGFAFRQFASFTQSGKGEVPFYRLQSIGGSRSLRGYEGDRFRDRNVVLVNAEVRCQIWHQLDMALFTDAGHVFNDVDGLGEGGVHVGYGVGFRYRKDGKTLGRIDLARGDEGMQVILDLGSLF